MSAFAPSAPRALGGPLVVWDAAFSPAELDRIVAHGDMNLDYLSIGEARK